MLDSGTKTSASVVQGVYSLETGNRPGMALPFLVCGISCGEPATAACSPAMQAPPEVVVSSRTRVASPWTVTSPTSADCPARRLMGPVDAALGSAVTKTSAASANGANNDLSCLDMGPSVGAGPEATLNPS